MKVVHIITGLNNGGAEGVLYRLVTHDKKNEHVVISLMDKGKYGSLLLDKGIAVHCLNMEAGEISPKSLLKLRKYLKVSKPDIVQTWMYHADLIGGLVARSLGIKNIFWNLRHSSFDINHTKSSTIKIAKLNAKLSKAIPYKIICCAEGAVEAHTDLGYSKEKIAVIANGYDLNTFKIDNDSREAIRNELNIGKKTVLGMVGRYDPQKNHKGLLESLSIVKQKGYDFDLVLVGKDLNKDNMLLLKYIKKYGLAEQTYLLDQRNDISGIMNALDIHILSSSYGEGFPNVIAEAMACGTPCIATNIGDSGIIIDDYGWLVEARSPKSLAEAIKTALIVKQDISKWKNMKISAQKQVIDNFSLEKMIDKYNSVWRESLDTDI